MPKTISVSEAKNRLSAMLSWAEENQDEIIVESHGQPKAVILSFSEYELFLALREQARRQAVLRRLETLAALNRARNADLSDDEAQQLADEVTRATIARMAAEGKVTFQE